MDLFSDYWKPSPMNIAVCYGTRGLCQGVPQDSGLGPGISSRLRYFDGVYLKVQGLGSSKSELESVFLFYSTELIPNIFSPVKVYRTMASNDVLTSMEYKREILYFLSTYLPLFLPLFFLLSFY